MRRRISRRAPAHIQSEPTHSIKECAARIFEVPLVVFILFFQRYSFAVSAAQTYIIAVAMMTSMRCSGAVGQSKVLKSNILRVGGLGIARCRAHWSRAVRDLVYVLGARRYRWVLSLPGRVFLSRCACADATIILLNASVTYHEPRLAHLAV